MLDQNTDRMWYVIGAVLIGAAIILAANSLFPGMFENITNSFSELLGNATDKIGDAGFTEVNTDVSGGDSGDPAGVINLIKTVPFF